MATPRRERHRPPELIQDLGLEHAFDRLNVTTSVSAVSSQRKAKNRNTLPQESLRPPNWVRHPTRFHFARTSRTEANSSGHLFILIRKPEP